MADKRDRLQKIMTQPINQIFRLFTSGVRVQIWLFDEPNIKIEGKIKGFDEYMNMVLDEAETINQKQKSRKSLGRILLKGDSMTLIAAAQ